MRMKQKDKVLVLGVAALGAYFLFFRKKDEVAPGDEDWEDTEVIDPRKDPNWVPIEPPETKAQRDYLINWAGTSSKYVNVFKDQRNFSGAYLESAYLYVKDYIMRNIPLTLGGNSYLYNNIRRIQSEYGIF